MDEKKELELMELQFQRDALNDEIAALEDELEDEDSSG